MTRKRATIIYNPMSGRTGSRADDVRAMERLLAGRAIEAEGVATRGPNDATCLARKAVAEGADIIVSYGGDGTLNEVIQGMAQSRTALAVWAGGTANVVARDLGLPSNIDKLADVIAAGETRRITLGIARNKPYGKANGLKTGRDGPSGPPALEHSRERYFFMFAGIGLDASIARAVNTRLKRRTGEFAFWLEGIRHIATWQPEIFQLDVDGQKYEAVFALLGNGKSYGGGICMTPSATLEEPWFEVYILPRRANNLAYLGDLTKCLRGNPAATSATIVRGKHIEANSAHEPWVEVDGEIIGQLPMTFDAVPDALSIIVPQSTPASA